MKRVTMDDLATHLGISKYSVSRALSGKSGVSEQTRERVWAAARKLGYELPRANSEGRRKQRGQLVLVMSRDEVHDHEVWMDVISGCEEAARQVGYSLITR